MQVIRELGWKPDTVGCHFAEFRASVIISQHQLTASDISPSLLISVPLSFTSMCIRCDGNGGVCLVSFVFI